MCIRDRERGEVCVSIRPGLFLRLCVSVLCALVACKTSLVAKEFSQHRLRSFRVVIASLQIGPTAQRAQLKHLETTLRTPPAAHTHRLRADRQRQATRRQQDTSQATDARCVCVSVLGCVYASVYPSCARWLLAKKVWLQKSFRSIVIVVFAL